MRFTESRLRISVACSIGGIVVLFGQIVGWATDACQVPNPSTIYCTAVDPKAVESCSKLPRGSCGGFFMMERNQFPQGAVKSASGTTQQIQSKCYCKQTCSRNPVTEVCESAPSCSIWYNVGETVPGTNICPTEE